MKHLDKIVSQDKVKLSRLYISHPTFISGIQSLFDLYGVRKHRYLFEIEDVLDMKSDFEIVGDDLRCAINELDSDING